MDQLRFDGRSVIVTGAGRGVGRAHALMLASRGAKVVVADSGGTLEGTGSSHEPADEVVDEIESAGGTAVAVYASVAEPDGAASIVGAAIDAFDRLDAVINNAGINANVRFEDVSLEQFSRMIAVHYLGTVHMCRAAWPHLVDAGTARIVNTCSEAMLGTHGNVSDYAGAKGGVYGFTRALAAEGPKHGIHVNGISPRASTRMNTPEVLARTTDLPEERFVGVLAAFRPELVSAAVAFLAHESCELNGEVLVAGAGQVQRLSIYVSRGISDDALTPEVVAEKLDAILDMSDPILMSSSHTASQAEA
jgi:NAD(P)-dependent dehydrogenase (short-subunit alcohol dehydrogenase family)